MQTLIFITAIWLINLLPTPAQAEAPPAQFNFSEPLTVSMVRAAQWPDTPPSEAQAALSGEIAAGCKARGGEATNYFPPGVASGFFIQM